MKPGKRPKISELFTTQRYHSVKVEVFYFTQKCYHETITNSDFRWPFALARGG